MDDEKMTTETIKPIPIFFPDDSSQILNRSLDETHQEVDQKEFFRLLYLRPENIHPEIVRGEYPWTSIFRDQYSRSEFGRRVPCGARGESDRWFILKSK